eukprot:TRINITY_DN48642_c0_g1_i1.p1 TRINITY_DN48642_c0_g1~~TRINITY_DN48642_c0_g1_i1.p1  ORF type:complete len:673 (+),score=168.88 TRINITY_DN48642_c0_g1_i1:42-2021(+)
MEQSLVFAFPGLPRPPAAHHAVPTASLRQQSTMAAVQGAVQGSPLATAITAAAAAAALAALAAGGRSRSRLLQRAWPSRLIRHAEAEGASTEAEPNAEQIFREAYEAEAERSKLLTSQLEAALAQQLGVGGEGGIKIAVQAPSAPSPLEPGGTTWRKAYEDVKERTASLESQLKKAKGMNDPPPAAAAAAAPSPPAAEVSNQATSSASDTTSGSTFQVPGTGGPLDPMEQVQRLREVAFKAAEEDAVLRLIALAALPNREVLVDDSKAPGDLPPLAQAREAMTSEDFTVSDSITFDRCYIFTGSVASNKPAGAALESMQNRMRSLTAPGAKETELYLQPAKEEGKSLLIMLHNSDLPDSEVPWWQWVLYCILILISFFASEATNFAVVPVTAQMAQSPEQMMEVIDKVLPAAGAIIGTVAAQETARRTVSNVYGVELTPPFLLPTWPIQSIGCLGAVTRRLSPVPNREAEYNMSLAAGLAGYAVSLGCIVAGLALGPGTDGFSLNYQLLPVVVKLLMKPFLGTSSVTNQPDPFSDAISVAFPASPLLIGGICGLVITSLSLLPIGRLDGGVLARNALGQAASPLGLLGFLLLLGGSFAPDDAGSLYFSFGLAAIVWQGGAEPPPKEAITDITDVQKALAIILVAAGFVLTVPGWPFPTI